MNLAMTPRITWPAATPHTQDLAPLTEWEAARWRRMAGTFVSARDRFSWATREYDRAVENSSELGAAKEKRSLDKAEQRLRRAESDLQDFYCRLRASGSAVEALTPAPARLIPKLVSEINIAETRSSDPAPLTMALWEARLTIVALKAPIVPPPEPIEVPDIPEALMEEAPEASEYDSMDYIAADPDCLAGAAYPPPAEPLVFVPATPEEDAEPIVLVEPAPDPDRVLKLTAAYERARAEYDLASIDVRLAPPERLTEVEERLDNARRELERTATELATATPSIDVFAGPWDLAQPDEQAAPESYLPPEYRPAPYARSNPSKKRHLPRWISRTLRHSPTVRFARWVMNW